MARRSTAAVGLQLRFSEQLRSKLEKAARDNDRSMNSEIVDRLERSFSQPQLAAELRMTIKEEVARAVLEATGRSKPASNFLPGGAVEWPLKEQGDK